MKKTKRKAIIMAGILGIFLLLVPAGAHLAPNDPYKTNLSVVHQPPSAEYPCGTDNLGRCIYSRILEGAARSVYSAVLIVGIVFVVGTVLGLLAGYMGGVVDQVIMKITMMFQAFPSFIFAVAMAGILGPGLKNSMLALSVMFWTTYARLGRGMVLQMKHAPYVQAAKLCGAKTPQILVHHIFPNILAPLLVTATLDVGNVILSMAGMSFLGLGVQPPMAEWGIMISNSKAFMQTAPWGIFFPSLALFTAVFLFNMTGDSIRDALDLGGEGGL